MCVTCGYGSVDYSVSVYQDDVGLQADQLRRERSHPIDVTAAPTEGPSAGCGQRSNPSRQALE
jgi:hypothetical protein